MVGTRSAVVTPFTWKLGEITVGGNPYNIRNPAGIDCSKRPGWIGVHLVVCNVTLIKPPVSIAVR
jgi:hypothetical protein